MNKTQHPPWQPGPIDQPIQLPSRLDFASTPALWDQLQKLIRNNPNLTLDLSQVEFANSAALALLLQSRQASAEQSGAISLQNIPADLLDLARLSNIDELLTSTL